MKRAIVTITLGKKHQKLWSKICKENWTQYCKKHSLDLIVIDTPLDSSERGLSRSPSWQKCLILNHPRVKEYEQVAWLDSDIIINNENAPNIFSGIQTHEIGGVKDWVYPTPELYKKMKEAQNNYAELINCATLKEDTISQYYTNFRLPNEFNDVVQGGVLVFSPKHHKELLEKVYYNYEDKGANYWHYEMRPLSYEILKSGNLKWLDERFNRIWEIDKELNCPALFEIYKKNTLLFKITRRLDFEIGTSFNKDFSETMHKYFKQSYFFHFAGAFSDMLLLKNYN